MKKLWIKFFSGIVVGLISFAANSQQPAGPGSSPSTAAQLKISPGTLLQLEISGDIDVKKVHAGDTFRTKLWDDVRDGGKILLPRNTTIVGHVVDAQPRTKENPESKLTIGLDKAVFKDGSELPLQGIVERVEYSSVAIAAAAETKSHSYNQSPFPGSTTNVAMPTQGRTEDLQVGPGPTNVQDKSIVAQGNSLTGQTVFTSADKADVKLRRFATLDVRVTHSGN